ncbi:MAG: peroxiredoxin [Ignavibacteriales bacterium]|jgi:1-Cys peroxiredoxin (EC 1.11.1.15)|nr:MAG: peroxiredoxin [Ignavibacteriaceae bacterium]MBW7873197.1 peroxiredoxin [Ignavibacteria bacterium]MCZ2142839.1 peroxiredoxin [Ignavibacteriales bacterium]OQY79286.1 MAG: peroxiredoxin [Ignavibacteriales bacterium UTCHB3]MBV6443933.1 Peroxiredoxin [Ignavibacteriaceae bacterium]
MENNQPRMPLLGDKMPELTVQTTHGVKQIPGDFAGKWLVLFSHPGDFTPVCTTEFVAFANRAEEFKKLNAELCGHSIDQVFSHIKWVEWIEEKLNVKIPFPVIADDMGNIAKSLGMIHPGKGTNTVRAVYVIDPDGILRLMIYYPQEIGRQVDEVLRALKALQISDANKVAMPENWPNNELIKDKVIIPPPKDVAAIESRQQFEGPDWWFKYKEL